MNWENISDTQDVSAEIPDWDRERPRGFWDSESKAADDNSEVSILAQATGYDTGVHVQMVGVAPPLLECRYRRGHSSKLQDRRRVAHSASKRDSASSGS